MEPHFHTDSHTHESWGMRAREWAIHSLMVLCDVHLYFLLHIGGELCTAAAASDWEDSGEGQWDEDQRSQLWLWTGHQQLPSHPAVPEGGRSRLWCTLHRRWDETAGGEGHWVWGTVSEEGCQDNWLWGSESRTSRLQAGKKLGQKPNW